MVQLASEGGGLPDISSLPPTHPGVLGGELLRTRENAWC